MYCGPTWAALEEEGMLMSVHGADCPAPTSSWKVGTQPHKTSWVVCSSHDTRRENEVVRPSFKPNHIITYLPAVWRSRKLLTVTPSPLGITSAGVELLVPHSVDKDLASKLDMWSALCLGHWSRLTLREGILVRLPAVRCAAGAGLWHVFLWTGLWLSLLPRGWDLALAKKHTHISGVWCYCSLKLHVLRNFSDQDLRHGAIHPKLHWSSSILSTVHAFIYPFI